jgi:DNA helicase-2/ATP-dependent DNA helicase PcrA
MRWASNIRDRVSGFRVAQLLPGIGASSAARLLDSMAESTDPVRALSEFQPPAAAREHWPDFDKTIGTLRQNVAGWPAELDQVCRWYGPHLERMHEDAALREADLTQLAQIASTYQSRGRFLTELTLDPPDATSDEAGGPLLDEDYLILSAKTSLMCAASRNFSPANFTNGIFRRVSSISRLPPRVNLTWGLGPISI